MPARQSIVRRLNLCEWVESSSVWIDMAALPRMRGPGARRGRVRRAAGRARARYRGHGQHDGGRGGPSGPPTRRRACSCTGSSPEPGSSDAHRARQDALRRLGSARAGSTLTPGPTVQMERVRAYVRELARARHRSRRSPTTTGARVSFAQSLEADGFVVVKIDQSPKGLTGACREWERLVAERKLQYGACPLLEAHVARTRIRVTDAGMMPAKTAETRAHRRALRDADGARACCSRRRRSLPSVYNTRGLLGRMSPFRRCAHPTCRALVRDGTGSRCPRHQAAADAQRRAYDRARSTDPLRIYSTPEWRAFRARSARRAAVVCGLRRPGGGRGSSDAGARGARARARPENVVPRCHRDHSRRTSREHSWNRR